MIKVTRISTDSLENFKSFTNNFLFDSNSLWFGATVHDIPCGSLLACKDKNNPQTCKIFYLFVHPLSRGMGVAHRLLDKLMEELKGSDIKEIIFNSNATDEEINILNSIFSTHSFEPAEIVANIYTIDYNAMYNSGNMNRFTKSKISVPKGIEILPWNQVNNKLIKSLKERVNIDFLEVYDPFPAEDKCRLNHINSFFAVAESKEIVGWLTGLDAFGVAISYEALFVKPEYRKLALGLVLMNFAIKNHIEKYPNKFALLGISLKNDHAEKFVSTYLKNVNKNKKHEFTIKKTIK